MKRRYKKGSTWIFLMLYSQSLTLLKAHNVGIKYIVLYVLS